MSNFLKIFKKALPSKDRQVRGFAAAKKGREAEESGSVSPEQRDWASGIFIRTDPPTAPEEGSDIGAVSVGGPPSTLSMQLFPEGIGATFEIRLKFHSALPRDLSVGGGICAALMGLTTLKESNSTFLMLATFLLDDELIICRSDYESQTFTFMGAFLLANFPLDCEVNIPLKTRTFFHYHEPTGKIHSAYLSLKVKTLENVYELKPPLSGMERMVTIGRARGDLKISFQNIDGALGLFCDPKESQKKLAVSIADFIADEMRQRQVRVINSPADFEDNAIMEA